MSDLQPPADFQLLFEATPHPYLVLRPDEVFTIVAVNDRYLAATGTVRGAIVGQGVFAIFPDNPEDQTGSGVSDLRTSLNRVLADRRQDVMGVQKYDIPKREGSGEFEVRYWSPVNTPVFSPAGDLLYITHHVEDVTEFILGRERASRESAEQVSRIEARAERSEAEVLRRATEVKEANRALKVAMEALERREAELARLNEQLQEQDRLKDASLALALHRLNAHIENSPLAIIEFDSAFRVTRWSETAEHLFGWRAEEIVGRAIAEVRWVPEEDMETVARVSAEMLAGASPRNRSANRNYRKDGTIIHCQWYNSALYDGQGNLVSILSQVLDVTEQKCAEDALRESESRFRTLADNMSQFAWMADEKGVIFWYNQRWYDYTGTRLEQMQGWGWRQVHHPDHVQRVVDKISHCFRTGEEWEDTFPLRRKDGQYRWFLSRALPIRDEQGKVVRWFGTNTDITEQRIAEEELRRWKDELEARVEQRTAELTAVNRELEAFTFATSHDLRGTLGRIKSFSTLLEQNYRNRLEGDGLVFLGIIRQNASRLVELVDDLLSHARISQHSLELQKMDVSAAVQAVLQEKAADIQEKGIELRVDLAPAQVLADPYAFSQALGNLVENALKYSSKAASPLIEIGGESRRDRFCLWVRDNGIGFKMEYHDKIFKIFQRLHTYTEYTGSGIGLALVQRAMERMGGRVWAESAPGQGATFFLEFQTAV